MNKDPLLTLIDDRVTHDREEGDIAYFHALTLKLEYVTKLTTAAVVACLGDDSDRHRYNLEHRLTRANAIGDWVSVLTLALTGPAAQFFDPDATNVIRDLTERVGPSDWRYSAINHLKTAATEFRLPTEVGQKVALRQFFEIAAPLRNRTRGHGATTADESSRCCGDISRALDLVCQRLQIFHIPWAYLHRNLSGKYRVLPLLGDPQPFYYLKSSRDHSYRNGVFLHLARHVPVSLVFTAPGGRDFLLPNGNYRDSSFETLSYITNDTDRQDASPWSTSPSPIPQSETAGTSTLGPFGNTYANVPPPPKSAGYVPRERLESRLADELLITDRHPILSLTGPGGIGKTTTALAAIARIANLETPPYDVIIWHSARDIDLLEVGPKQVAPRVVTQREIAKATVQLANELIDASGQGRTDAEATLQEYLTQGVDGLPTRFVLDNFETIQSPTDVFNWIDTCVRPPNKVLITTRFRNFKGDYPLEIGGMTDEESHTLINQHSSRLGVSALLDTAYRERLLQESGGHPYVIRIFLGEVANAGHLVTPKRALADNDALLRALFERTYGYLSPAAQRVFLVLCSWRVVVPEVAVEAIAFRPGVEYFDVASALSELKRFSLVDQVSAEGDEEVFVGVPLSASIYGQDKLKVSPQKAAVQEDLKLLKEFGAGKRTDAQRGVMPRIERLIRAVAERGSSDKSQLHDLLPVLRFLADRIPTAYRRLADLMLEVDDSRASRDEAREFLRLYLQHANTNEHEEVWLQLADLCHADGDVRGEVHALSEVAVLPGLHTERIGAVANRLNNLIRSLKGKHVEDAWSGEVRELLQRVIDKLEQRVNKLSGTDCSRLAWLHLNVKNTERARDIAKIGLRREPRNEHCQKLLARLES